MYTFRFKVGPKKVGLGGKQLKYVARPYYAGKQSEKDIVKQTVENTRGVNEDIIYSVLEAVTQEFREHLFLGHPVKLAGLGTFRISFDSATHDSPDDFTATDIKNPRIIFTPDMSLRREMAQVLRFQEYKE